MKKRYVTVQVTQHMIDTAVPGDCYDCLIAKALVAATGHEWHVMKHDARIETDHGRKPLWKFPPDVRRLMVAFDNRERVGPCEFWLPARFAAALAPDAK